MKLFTANWCINCKSVKRLLDEKGIEVDMVDLDEKPELAQEAGVRSIPALQDSEGNLHVGVSAIVKAVVGK